MCPYFQGKPFNILCGFRKWHRTQSVFDKINSKLEEISLWIKYIGINSNVFIKRFFDCLPHDHLIAKLEEHRFDFSSHSLMYKYTDSSYQWVKIALHRSIKKELKIGIQQGSFLDSLLFDIFINDLFQRRLDSEIYKLAVDSSV